MVAKSARKSKVLPAWQGGVAGAGTGTSLLVFVNSLPDKGLLKPMLTYLSPSIAIAMSLTWAYAISALKDWLNDRKMTAQWKKSKELRNQIESNPYSSEEHKKAVRKVSEELELELMEIRTERVVAIRAIDK